MTDLYFRNGHAPAPLPFEAYDANGRLWTDLANNEEGFETCGFRKAPARPDDTDAQVAKWDLDDEEWVMVNRPPVPPSPPNVIVINPPDLWRRATEAEAEKIEEAMAAQSAKLRNLFRTASTYRNDDPLWPVLWGAAVQLFEEPRAAELLAPSA